MHPVLKQAPEVFWSFFKKLADREFASPANPLEHKTHSVAYQCNALVLVHLMLAVPCIYLHWWRSYPPLNLSYRRSENCHHGEFVTWQADITRKPIKAHTNAMPAASRIHWLA